MVGALVGARRLKAHPGKQESIDSLTGLRFIAALVVLVGHAAAGLVKFDPPAGFVTFFQQGPAIGMPLFFVLSGFVIHYNYSASFRSDFIAPTVDFFIARFARLYPLYLFVLLLYIFNQRLLPGMLSQQYDFSVLPRYLLLWQAWSIEYRGTTWFGHLLVPPAWSISVEVFFYAIYPLLALPILRLASAARAGAVLAAVAVFFYAAILACYLHFDALRIWGNHHFNIDADPQNALLGWLMNTGPVGRLWEFLMGALTAQAYLVLRDRPPGPRETLVGSLVLYAAILLAAGFYTGMGHNALLAFAGSYAGGLSPVFAVIIFCCARYGNPVSRLLGTRAMVVLGDASYSIYLLHFFTLQLFHLPLAHRVEPLTVAVWIVQTLGAIAFTIVLSLGTYRVIEAPSRAWLRRKLTQFRERCFARWRPRGTPLAPAASAALLVCTAAVLAWWNWPARNPIEIVAATYGENCRAFVAPAPFVNLFRENNVRASVRQACAGAAVCNFMVDANVIGDPVPGCAKDFSITYRCAPDEAPKTVTLPPEANGAKAFMSCGGMEILDATYGASCREFTPPSPAVNLFKPGNARISVRDACAGKTACDYEVNVSVLGDPASGCGKDFSVTYLCPSDPDPRTEAIPAEAHGRKLSLTCAARGAR